MSKAKDAPKKDSLRETLKKLGIEVGLTPKMAREFAAETIRTLDRMYGKRK